MTPSFQAWLTNNAIDQTVKSAETQTGTESGDQVRLIPYSSTYRSTERRVTSASKTILSSHLLPAPLGLLRRLSAHPLLILGFQ